MRLSITSTRLQIVWRLLFAAAYRRLEKHELKEFDRLLAEIEAGLAGDEVWNQRIREFALAIRTSGLFEHGGPLRVQPLLVQAEDLRTEQLERDRAAKG